MAKPCSQRSTCSRVFTGQMTRACAGVGAVSSDVPPPDAHAVRRLAVTATARSGSERRRQTDTSGPPRSFDGAAGRRAPSGSQTLDDERDPLAATDAGAAETIAVPAGPQGVQEMGRDARAARAERMAERDRAA